MLQVGPPVQFDLAGIAVSAGSACSSGKMKQSAVLAAMGVAPEIANTMASVQSHMTSNAATPSQYAALGAYAFLRAWGFSFAAALVGGIAYGIKKPNPWPGTFGYHEVFHAMTVVAATCHYIAVYFAMYNSPLT